MTEHMKSLLKMEELALGLLAFALFLRLDVAWWWFFVLFLAPDLSMLGYAISPRIGALSYNLVHHKAVAIAVYLVGAAVNLSALQAAGLVLLAHSSIDRVTGYGLKYADAFRHTQLGMIGRARMEAEPTQTVAPVKKSDYDEQDGIVPVMPGHL